MSELLPLSSTSSKAPDFTGEEEGCGLLSIVTGLGGFRDGGAGSAMLVSEEEEARRQERLFSSKRSEPRRKSGSGGMRRMWSMSVDDSSLGVSKE